MGKFLAILLVGCAVIAGGGMYYLQVYHYYDEVVSIPGTDVALTPQGSSEAEPVSYDNFQGIDADSSPIRYRACFTTSLSHATLDKTYRSYKPAEPRVAPGWFDCFDATEVGEALESGAANMASTASLPFMRTGAALSGIRSTAAARSYSMASLRPMTAPHHPKGTETCRIF